MTRHVLAALACVALLGVGCASDNTINPDTYITDCDMLTQELARIRQGMRKNEVQRILGVESWVIYGLIDDNDVYRQIVVYNYNDECLKLRGRDPSDARRRVIIEYANEAVDRVTDSPVNQDKRGGLFGL